MMKNIATLFALLILALGVLTLAGTFKVLEMPQKEEAAAPEKLLGFIRGVNNNEIIFDDARWLSGKEGEDAAIAAGFCTEETRSECLPNDYFILNSESSAQPLALASGAKIFMQTWEAGEFGIMRREIGPAQFAQLIGDPVLHFSQLPYDVTLKDGLVILIEEIYIP